MVVLLLLQDLLILLLLQILLGRALASGDLLQGVLPCVHLQVDQDLDQPASVEPPLLDVRRIQLCGLRSIGAGFS